jgi:hypothetical protein
LPPSKLRNTTNEFHLRRYTAFISASILLYTISQLQIHNLPEAEWRPYLILIDNDFEVLAYCQELDPVATRLRDTLSQYMQFLRVPSLAPKRKAPKVWVPAALEHPSSKTPQGRAAAAAPPHSPDIVDLLLSAPTGRAGPVQTSNDLLKLVCQPFNDDEAADSEGPRSSSSGYNNRVPHLLGDIRHDSTTTPRDKWGRQASDSKMPFGWQQCHSSTTFTGKSTNLALTMAQQEMLRAGV